MADKGPEIQEYLIELRLLLDDRFSEEELRTLCYDLGVPYEDLPAQGAAGKARELVDYLERRDRIPKLIAVGQRQRPDISWPKIDASSPPPAHNISPERVRKYLPFKLYNGLLLEPTPEMRRKCIDHLTALLRVVSTYCSPPILEDAHPSHIAQGKWHEATLLFADISGFTKISEQLNTRGTAGAEEITNIVNRYFAAMVDSLVENSGYLIKFGGDALLGMFVGPAYDTARYAAQTAMDMQRQMTQFADIDTSVGRSRLDMKVAIHTGRVFAAHVGTATQMEYWLTGQDVNFTARIEDMSERGQVLASEATCQHLKAWGTLEALPSDDPSQMPVYVLPKTSGYEPLEPQVNPGTIDVPTDMDELVRRLDMLTPYLSKGLLPRLVYNPRKLRVEGEHRLVAVLFINVEGFSELAAPPEADQPHVLAEAMQDYFSTMQSIVEGHGGVINKTDLYPTGDKVLAIFGAPVARGDDVDQAARAAVALQSALEGVNQRLAARFPEAEVRLRQRIGFSTGTVFSGNVGAKVRQEYTIMGDEVNLAARLMSAAEWGEVWVSSHVYYWLEPFGEFNYIDDIKVKGKREPVPVYQLDDIGEVYRPQPDFVDRVDARAELERRFDQLLEDPTQGQIVLVTGEPGIGKSRLWSTLHPDDDSVLWLTGRCHEQRITYHLMADILRDYLGVTRLDTPEIQRQKLIEKLEDLFGAGRAETIAPFLSIVMGLPLPEEWKKYVEHLEHRLPARIVEQVKVFFDSLTDTRPLVVICEDLHWLDRGSADILLRIVESVEYAPLMLGVTLRPGQSSAYDRIASAVRERYKFWLAEIALDPLDPEHCSALVSGIAPRPLSPEQQEQIYHRSGGNPLFVVEIALTAFAAPSLQIPNNLHILIQSRIDMLKEGTRLALEAASVIGVRFSLPELVYLLGERERDVRKHLAALRRMRLVGIEERGYKFTQTLTQEVVYLGQNLDARRALHRRLADYWEEKDVSKAAYHYFAGELWPEALDLSRRAADYHRQEYANQEAIRFYDQALHAAGELGNHVAQGQLYHQLGEVYHLVGNYSQAVHAFEQELNYPADPAARAEAHYGMARAYYEWSEFAESLNMVKQGLVWDSLAPSVTGARLLRVRCAALHRTGELTAAQKAGEEALEIVESLDEPTEEAYIYNNLGGVFGEMGDLERALEYHQRSLALRREMGNAYAIDQSLGNVATVLSYMGRLDEAEAHYEEAMTIQERIGDLHGLSLALPNLAWVYWDRGELERAEETFKQGLAVCKRIENRVSTASIDYDLGQLYRQQGRLEEARDSLKRSADLYEELKAGTHLPDNYRHLAEVYLEFEQSQRAQEAAQKALKWAERNENEEQIEAAQKLLKEIGL
jgi:class 3 adenylate cyclase/tetratricopeptide (TPR) repeat protein